MKKSIILITLILLIFIPTKNTYAKTTFYEGEYIPNIWLNRKNHSNGTTYYNQARFIKETSTNKIAYCIEPFTNMSEGEIYNETSRPSSFSESQIEEMMLISHFGYGYQNHTDLKWYAITQIMIWEIADPNGTYYISTYQNGPATQIYNAEINEIKTLVNNYKKDTIFNNKIYTIVEDTNLQLEDTNQVLNTFKIISNNATINNNTLTTPVLKEGKYEITLQKESKLYNRAILFYQSQNSQDVIDIGDPLKKINKLNINVIKTTVKIEKYDKEKVGPISQGEAQLSGTTFSLYTTKGDYINDIVIGEDCTYTIKNLDFGTYYLKEKIPGTGYELNKNNHYFTLNKTQTNINVTVFNKVIKGKLKIKKEYGYKDTYLPEPNISFNIYDKNNILIKTIITDENGETEIELPNGKYKIYQLTTTEGYKKIEPQEFEIKDTSIIYKYFKNYKIEVPNTKTESLLTKIINLLKELLC